MHAQFIIFKITDDKKYIEIESKGEKGASFEEFKSKLPDGDCRYAVLDVEINTKSGATTNKLIFVAWYDNNSPSRSSCFLASRDPCNLFIQGCNSYEQRAMPDCYEMKSSDLSPIVLHLPSPIEGPLDMNLAHT